MMDHDQSKQYHRGKRYFFYGGLVLDVLFLLVLQLSDLSVALRILAFQVSSVRFFAYAIYTVAFFLAFSIVQLPLNFFADYVWEHRFGLSRHTVGSWLTDEIKKTALGLVLSVILVEVIYYLLCHFPYHWWMGAAGFWLFLSLFLARIMPDVIIPLFYKYTPIENEELRQRIFSLFEKCRVGLKDIYAINLSAKSKKANAFICGLGRSRRVVLSDTLLEDFSPEEIEAVVAHELGHHKNRDIGKLIVGNSLLIVLAFYLMDKLLGEVLSSVGVMKQDIAGLPMVMLGMLIFSFVTTPFVNAFSRWLEIGADRFSLKLTGKPEAFITMMEKLGKLNLEEFSPGLFDEMMFYSHPPIRRRIEKARAFRP